MRTEIADMMNIFKQTGSDSKGDCCSPVQKSKGLQVKRVTESRSKNLKVMEGINILPKSPSELKKIGMLTCLKPIS